ncbi:hypothetical protein D3C86_1012970 [compost metagenome]
MQLHLAQCLLRRALRDDIDNAAGAACAIDGGGRAAQDGNGFHAIGLKPGAAVLAADLPQAVAENACGAEIGTAHLEGVEARFRAILADARAGRVVQRFGEVLRLQIIELLAADGGDRLRGFGNRRIGLGGGAAGFADIAIALDDAPGAFKAGALHGDWRKQGAAGGGRTAAFTGLAGGIENANRIAAGQRIVQPRSGEKPADGRRYAERALDARSAAAPGDRGGVDHAQIGLAAKAEDGVFQRPRGNGDGDGRGCAACGRRCLRAGGRGARTCRDDTAYDRRRRQPEPATCLLAQIHVIPSHS